jgi:hypothetical protein
VRQLVLRIAAPVVCFVAGLFFIVLAADASRWPGAFDVDDVRYRGNPEADLWSPERVVPARLVKVALGVEDDVAYRNALRAFRNAHPETPGVSDPALVVSRNEATAELTDIVEHAKDPLRRSSSANLLGALNYADAIYDVTNRAKLISNASSRFQQAIAFDPSNADAKFNLQLALALSRGLALSESGGGTNPSPGGKGSRGAGTGDPGSGY